MPRWLAENPTTVYAILGALALVVLIAAWMNRDRFIPIELVRDRRKEPRTINALALGGILVALLAVLAGLVALIDYLVVTDQEQIVRIIEEMADGVRSRDTERVFRHVSESFSARGRGKKEFREFARRYIESGEVTDVVVWEFRFEGEEPRANKLAKVFFYAKARANIRGSRQDPFYLVEADFCLDPDGQWRLKWFQFRNPVAHGEVVPGPY
ncbi:MAG TPA: hypothetical protein VNK04_15925 [Gemmataceae bacterium]|nr:hypothetical protein [Gemmataceae bacterium]